MTNNLEIEIKKRHKSDIWSRKIQESVLKKVKKEKQIFILKITIAFLFFVFLSVNSYLYYEKSHRLQQEQKIATEWLELMDEDLEDKVTLSSIILTSF